MNSMSEDEIKTGINFSFERWERVRTAYQQWWDGTLSFELPERFSYAFFEYEIQTKLIGTGDRDKARSMNDVT